MTGDSWEGWFAAITISSAGHFCGSGSVQKSFINMD